MATQVYDITNKAGPYIAGIKLLPGQTQITLTTEQSIYELAQGTILPTGQPGPTPPEPPAILGSDMVRFLRSGLEARATVTQLVGYMAEAGLVEPKLSARAVDIRELVTGLAFNGTTDDGPKFAAAFAAAEAGTRIIVPGLPALINTTVTVPAKALAIDVEPNGLLLRSVATPMLDVASALQLGKALSVTGSIVATAINVFKNTASTSLVTRFQVTEALTDQVSVGSVIRIVADNPIPNQTPFDAGETKKAYLGDIGTVVSVDPANSYVFIAGELPERGLYGTNVKLVPIDKDARFSWRGGRFYSSGSWVGVNIAEYFRIKSRVEPIVEEVNILNGSGSAVSYFGCLNARARNSEVADMQNTATVVGYGFVDHGGRAPIFENIRGSGDMRHVTDANIVQLSAPGSAGYDFYGRSRDGVARDIEGVGLGHTPTSTHSEARGWSIINPTDTGGVAGRSSAGGMVSSRSAETIISGLRGRNKPVGIELFEQVSGNASDITVRDFDIRSTSSALLVTSIDTGTLLRPGVSLRNIRIELGIGVTSRGSMIVLAPGSYRFTRNFWSYRDRDRLPGDAPAASNALAGNFGLVMLTGSNTAVTLTEETFDLSLYSGASISTAVVLRETGNRSGQVIRFERCKFITAGNVALAALVDAGSTTSQNVYEFVDCEIPPGTPLAINQGSAIVRVIDTRAAPTPAPASGELIGPTHLITSTANALNTGGAKTFMPLDIGALVSFDAVGVLLTTAQAGAACRFVVHEDEGGKPGAAIVDFGELDLSAGSGYVSKAIAWTPGRKGRFWLMSHYKGGINPQITANRVANVVPGFVNGKVGAGEWAIAATNGLRYFTTTDTAYGAATIGSKPPGIAASNGSDAIVALLRVA